MSGCISRWFCFFEGDVEVDVGCLVLIQTTSCTSNRLNSLVSCLLKIIKIGMLFSWIQIKPFARFHLLLVDISSPAVCLFSEVFSLYGVLISLSHEIYRCAPKGRSWMFKSVRKAYKKLFSIRTIQNRHKTKII